MTGARACSGTIEIREFSGLNEARLDCFRRYAREHFYNEFRAEQGTEDVLATLARFGRGGAWMDLGAGPTTLFWSIPLSGITSITCCDLMSEALKVLDEFVKSAEVPRCYRQVLEMFGREQAHLEDIKKAAYTLLLHLRRARTLARGACRQNLRSHHGVGPLRSCPHPRRVH